MLILALCGGYFLVLLDVTVVNVALPSIGAELLVTGADLAWIVDAYTVPLAALLLAAGATGDLLGHRRVVLAGFAGFGVASIVCAVAPELPVLVAGRAAQGVCAALMLPGTLALLTGSAPDDAARTRLVGRWAAVGGCALPAGPFLGGLLIQALGWRSVFWLNVPLLAAAFIPVALAPRGARHRGSRVDWLGAALLVVAVGSAVTAVLESPWLGVLAVLAAVGFAVAKRRAARPLLRVPAAARGPLAAACAVAGLMNCCVLGSLFLLTQVFQDGHRMPPLATGLLLLPAMLPLPLLGTTAGRLVHRLGPWRTSAIGLGFAATGFAVLAATLGAPGSPLLLAGLACWGAGLGILTPAVVTAALHALPSAPGTASGASNTARQVGGALGVALCGTLAGPDGLTGRTTLLLAGCAGVFALLSALSVLGVLGVLNGRRASLPGRSPAS